MILGELVGWKGDEQRLLIRQSRCGDRRVGRMVMKSDGCRTIQDNKHVNNADTKKGYKRRGERLIKSGYALNRGTS